MEPVAWSYLDVARTHHVQTGLARGQRLEFVVRESDPRSSDEAETFVRRHVLMDPWEARAHQLELETRLTLLGPYLRSAGGAWTPLPRPASLALVDLAPLEMDGGDAAVEFHHFAEPDGRHAVTLVGVHQALAPGERVFLARLDYNFPDVNGGNLQVLHPRLPPSVHRSLLAAQHLELRELGFRKLPRRADLAMDARSWRTLHAVLDALLARLLEGRLGKPGEGAPVGGGGLDLIAQIEALAILRKTRGAAAAARSYDTDFEFDPDAGLREARRPSVLFEDLPGDVVESLNDPRLLALHERYLAPGEDKRLVEEGHLAIVRAMRSRRDAADPRERHLISLVEASLLLRRALLKRTTVDKEVIERVRHAGAFL